MIKCSNCPRKVSCTIEPSTCYAPMNYTTSLPKVKTETEIRADERAKTIEECKEVVRQHWINGTVAYRIAEEIYGSLEKLKEQK